VKWGRRHLASGFGEELVTKAPGLKPSPVIVGWRGGGVLKVKRFRSHGKKVQRLLQRGRWTKVKKKKWIVIVNNKANPCERLHSKRQGKDGQTGSTTGNLVVKPKVGHEGKKVSPRAANSNHRGAKDKEAFR